MGRNCVRDIKRERLCFGGSTVSCLRRGLGKMEKKAAERERERERERENDGINNSFLYNFGDTVDCHRWQFTVAQLLKI